MVAHGQDIPDMFGRAAACVDKILKGEKRLTAVELVVNLKTAKALGMTIPPSILARADELIA